MSKIKTSLYNYLTSKYKSSIIPIGLTSKVIAKETEMMTQTTFSQLAVGDTFKNTWSNDCTCQKVNDSQYIVIDRAEYADSRYTKRPFDKVNVES